MGQLRQIKESAERSMSFRMSAALSSFVDGRISVKQEEKSCGPTSPAITAHQQNGPMVEPHSTRPPASQPRANSIPHLSSSLDQLSLKDGSDDDDDDRDMPLSRTSGVNDQSPVKHKEPMDPEMRERESIFARAAYLLRDAMEVDGW